MFKTSKNFGGYWVKNVKKIRGHEGEPCPYGSLYKDNKKVGSFAVDTWGGPMTVDFIKRSDAQVLQDYLATLPLEELGHGLGSVPLNDEWFISKILEAHATLQYWKNVTKKRCAYKVGTDFGTMNVPYKGNEGRIKDFLEKKYGKDSFVIVDEILASLEG